MLHLLDILLTLVHLLIISFNLFGWMWPAARKAHLVCVGLTAASWFILGAWYGWGYCAVTDWQWQVKEKLGEKNLPNSFIKYYADKIAGRNISAALVDNVTLAAFLAAIVLTLYVNFVFPRLNRKRGNEKGVS